VAAEPSEEDSLRAQLDAALARLELLEHELSRRTQQLDEIRGELATRVDERTAELEREQTLLSAVVQRVPAPLVVVESPTGRTLIANEEAERMLDELAPAYAGADPAYRWRDFRPIAAAIQGETITGEAVEVTRPDGRRFALEVNAVPIHDRTGRIVRAVAVLLDVTERERRERAEREFVTNAAHELLTPLAAITSAVEVLQGGAKEDPEQRERFLAHAERETARLGRLARALLVLARAQMGTEAPRGEMVEVAPLLDEIVAGLQPAANVSVTVDCPPRLVLVTNRELATQALLNVGTNAAKFTPAGSILFRARLDGDASVVVEVSDSGPGIPADEGEQVFDRFYRSREMPDANEGFGLGLAIARQAVEALGGTIELRSTPGQGTTVAVTLPGAELVRR
jgi:signal transduction histidine kinase